MKTQCALLLLSGLAVGSALPANASVSSAKIDAGNAPVVVSGWGCVVIPGSGQWCGETGDDKIPDER